MLGHVPGAEVRWRVHKTRAIDNHENGQDPVPTGGASAQCLASFFAAVIREPPADASGCARTLAREEALEGGGQQLDPVFQLPNRRARLTQSFF